MFLTYMNFLLQIIVFNRSYNKYFEEVKMPGVTKRIWKINNDYPEKAQPLPPHSGSR
jgi:hypothetical protein